jgi:hypothetical protein
MNDENRTDYSYLLSFPERLRHVMTGFSQKLLQGVQMLHGTVFSKRVPLAAGGKVFSQQKV